MLKSKLKKVDKSAYGYDPFESDNYHCCRWCHYYKNGKCLRDDIIGSEDEDLSVYQVLESGKLDAVLEEVIASQKTPEFKKVEALVREWGVSQKRLKEFSNLLMECIENTKTDIDIRDEISGAVSSLYETELSGRADNFDGIPIKNPEDFYCKYFW